jgi:hypothetical protein
MNLMKSRPNVPGKRKEDANYNISLLFKRAMDGQTLSQDPKG